MATETVSNQDSMALKRKRQSSGTIHCGVTDGQLDVFQNFLHFHEADPEVQMLVL